MCDIEELTHAETGMKLVWSLLDETCDKLEQEKYDDIHEKWESIRRLPGQSIADYINHLKKLKLELLTEDKEKVISAKEWGRKLLRCANLTQEQQSQVFLFAGAVYNALRIEAVMRKMFARIGDAERRQGKVLPSKFTSNSASSSRTGASSSRSSTMSTRTPSSGRSSSTTCTRMRR